MSESLSTSIFEPSLKELYPDRRRADLAMRKQPFLAMVKKRDDFGGELRRITAKYVNPQGGSAAFSNAQSNTYAGREVKFNITRKSNYQLAHIDAEVIEASATDAMALTRALKDRMDGAMENLGHDLGRKLFQAGGGALGRVASGFGTPTITLTDTRDTRFFEVGMTVTGGTTDGTSNGTKRVGTAQITAINRQAGQVTVSGNWTASITGLTTNDYLFRDGDTNANNNGTALNIQGLAAWIPSVAPTATLFNDVDRSVDTDRLGGIRYDATNKTIENALTYLASDLADAGATPDIVFASPKKYADLKVSLGTRVNYEMIRGAGHAAHIAFNSVVLDTDDGQVKVVSDRNCPNDRMYMLTMDTWCFDTLGGVTKIIRGGSGGQTRTRESADGEEFRVVNRGDLWCDAPGHNGVLFF